MKDIWNEDEIGMIIQKSEFFGIDNKNKDLTLKCKVKTSNTSDDEMIYFNPFLEKTFQENPFKLEERKYPVDFGNTFRETYTLTLKLPENYTVEELPKSVNLVMPDKSISYTQSIGEILGSISVRITFKINKPVFSAKEYKQLKEIVNLIIEKQSEQIVLKKKG